MQVLVLGVWKIVCWLENGGSVLVASLYVLLRLALNQGQHPWESNPEGVIRSCCHSSVMNGEGKGKALVVFQWLVCRWCGLWPRGNG